MKVLLTGATGFIGSHILKILTDKKFEVIGTCRTNSNLDTSIPCRWINVNDPNWQEEVRRLNPDVLVHTAWSGVDAQNRDNWLRQIENITFQQQLLDLNISKVIALGSQAEYGTFEAMVDENFPANPTSAYGAIKLASLDICRSYCELQGLKWYWLRLFSVFGENEGEQWLIPSVVKSMREGGEMDFTGGEQRYSYLYVDEIAHTIVMIIENNPENGVYNLGNSETISIRELLEKIRNYVNPDFQLNFGVLPYRKNQSMLMGCINDKICSKIYKVENTNFDELLQRTIDSYL